VDVSRSQDPPVLAVSYNSRGSVRCSGRGSRVESERHKSNKVKQYEELFGETGIDFDNWSVVSFTTSTPPILRHVSKVKSKSKSKSKSGDGASAGEDVPS
jgi:hypothetical protein